MTTMARPQHRAHGIDATETRRRIWAIVGGSSGNLVEWFFGRVADKQGRRISMMIAVIMMCGGSLMVALLPTYASIGVAAPLLLLVARLVQGLSVGGEYGTSATYMSEVAVHRHRGFFASFQYVTLIGGQLLAVLVLALFTGLSWLVVPAGLRKQRRQD